MIFGVPPIDPKALLGAGALGVMWLLEGAIPMFEGRRERLRHDAANLTLGMVNAAITAFVFAGAALVVTEWARANGEGVLHWIGASGAWGLALSFVLFDLWQYLWHRLNHRLPFLWRFHAVHHADGELSASSGLRFHTGEIVLSSLARLAVLPLLGMTLGQLVVYEAALLPVILFHHGNVKAPDRVDRLLRWIIVTPRMHWVHHSDYQPETDSNFSSVFSFWDRVFGSFRVVADPTRLTLGLDGVERHEWATLSGMAAMPFRARSEGRAGERSQTRRVVAGGPPGVRVFAPASISNLGCGFDVLGMALEGIGDTVCVREAAGRGVVSVEVSGDGGLVPRDRRRNAAALAVQGVLDRVAPDAGVAVEVAKGIPVASGLGGSAASAVAGAVAANKLLGGSLDRSEIFACAMIGEIKGSGSNAPDNTAASLTGGLALVLPSAPWRVVSLPAPRDMVVAVTHPALTVETLRARKVLGDSIALEAGVAQWGNVGGLVAGLYEGDWDLIAACARDAVAEPKRAALVPGFERVKRDAMAAGAVAAGMSGSGPTVFAICRGREAAERAGRAMAEAYRREAGAESRTVIARPGAPGARVEQAVRS